MNDYSDEGGCYFHPRELVVGVCASCLNERLLLVQVSKQQTHTRNYSFTPKRVLPKIFALANLLNSSHTKHKPEVDQYSTSSTSQEDSFISIKFEENGVGLWDKGKILHDQQCVDEGLDKTMKIKSVIEHPKPLRWRRRIGHLFHLIKWKRSSKANVCHVGTSLNEGRLSMGG